MTKNAETLYGIIYSALTTKYEDHIPAIEEFEKSSLDLRENLKTIYPVTDEEFKGILKQARESILVTIGVPHSLKGEDATHQSWYPLHKNDGFYWNRYRKYLETRKKWSPDVVRQLNETTDSIMDDLGDPTDPNKAFKRRGLLLGDVQSGKTSTYTAICNKAADCGYRVIIVLTGMLENLRFQTQERLDAEFAGRESKYALDTKADQTIKNKSVGVGKIGPFDQNKRISCFTSVSTDFSKAVLKSNDLTLRNLKGTALFVVKKNKSVLNNLYKWLMDNNTDGYDQKIDLSLLLIDDEADNASVNTQSEDHDPTAINIAIRNILNSFYQTTYLGITATPFANIFINPDTPDGQPDDLFPKHFLTVLPTPSHYIGADAIFGSGSDFDWHIRSGAPYSNTIIEIYNNEMKDYFRFGHKKDLADDLYDLPASLYEATAYFILASAVRDVRGNESEHASMLVNVSISTAVHNRIAELLENWIKNIRRDVENYGRLTEDQALKIKNMQYLKLIWDKYNFEQLADSCDWITLQQEFLFDAIKRIETRAINKDTGSSSLNYYAYKNIGLRVIAVGGNSLSRGITLEGLCVSYFYRNTTMYDTLLQMGRWFGYRPNYSDLFKIWMAEDAVDWYGFITDATNELKEELKVMERQNQTPEEFGLKVRQDPSSLIVTARNKMRTGTLVSRPITVSGRLLETPRLKNRAEVLKNNEQVCRSLISLIDGIDGVRRIDNDSPKALIWHQVPQKYVVDLVRNFDTHPWHLNFQAVALAEYIEKNALDNWDIAIPFGSDTEPYLMKGAQESITIYPEARSIKEDKDMLRVSGTHVKVGAGTSTRIGLIQTEIEKIKKEIEDYNKTVKPTDKQKITDRTYLIKNRPPILMIHVIKTKAENANTSLEKCPPYLFALGLGFPNTGEKEIMANYIVNINELKNWVDIDDEEDDD